MIYQTFAGEIYQELRLINKLLLGSESIHLKMNGHFSDLPNAAALKFLCGILSNIWHKDTDVGSTSFGYLYNVSKQKITCDVLKSVVVRAIQMSVELHKLFSFLKYWNCNTTNCWTMRYFASPKIYLILNTSDSCRFRANTFNMFRYPFVYVSTHVRVRISVVLWNITFQNRLRIPATTKRVSPFWW